MGQANLLLGDSVAAAEDAGASESYQMANSPWRRSG